MEAYVGKSVFLDAGERGRRSAVTSPYVYYSLMDDWYRKLYDAVLALYSHPTDAGYRAEIVMPGFEDPGAVTMPLQTAVLAAAYDHPNMFWIWDMLGDWEAKIIRDGRGLLHMRLRLKRQPADLGQKSVAFEKQVDRILSGTDRSGRPHETERRLHDGLIGFLAYDMEAPKDRTLRPDKFSAYGALMRGEKGSVMAVCNGYALAFSLLLQRCGIRSAVVPGYLNGGLHAWTLVQLDGDWYEVDPTMDDALDPDGSGISIDPALLKKFMKDKTGMENLRHRYFNLTTRQIRNMQPDSGYELRAGGMRWQVSAATQHVRACEPGAVQPWQDCYRDLAALLPQAEGTRYAYQRKKRGLFW